MRLELLQYLFTLRYYKTYVPCAKGYTENENIIIANLQFCDWYHFKYNKMINTKEEIYYVLYVNDYNSIIFILFLYIIVYIVCFIICFFILYLCNNQGK